VSGDAGPDRTSRRHAAREEIADPSSRPNLLHIKMRPLYLNAELLGDDRKERRISKVVMRSSEMPSIEVILLRSPPLLVNGARNRGGPRQGPLGSENGSRATR